MKKIFCFLIVLLICFGSFGCGQNEFETIQLDEEEYVYGKITEKISTDVLALKVGSPASVKKWGETVHIVTDQADEWCVGDMLTAYFTVIERPYDTFKPVRIIAKSVSDPSEAAKPIIYLYPEVSTVCSVKLTLKGELTCTYPAHGTDGWQGFTANPDGTLIFPDGREYYALYWEGVQNTEWDLSRGWCVRGEDTAEFLEWALEAQGLNRREANEFIVYWLPLMQDNPYNVISFQTEAYTDSAILDVEPAPDSLLRVFMTYYPTEIEVDIEPQTLRGFVRRGFTVVEWGGSQVPKP